MTTELELEPKSLIELSRLYDEDPALIADKTTRFYAWVRRVRVGGGGTIVFLDLYDGTKVGALNCLASEADYTPHGTTGEQTQDEKNYKALTFEQLSQAEHLSIGCAVVVDGKIVLSPPTATQDFEFQVSCVRLIGGVEDPTKYPITKSTEKTMSTMTTELELEPKSLIELSRLYDEDPALIADKTTRFYAWVRRVRVGGGGTIVFLDLYDGTKVGALNCLASEADYTPHGTTGEQTQDEKNYKALTFEQLSQAEHLSIGCAVVVDGKIVLSPPTATQDFEFQVSCVRLIGGVEDPTKYPITKSTEKTMSTMTTELELEPKSLIELSRLYDEDPALIADKTTRFYAWVRRVRVGGGGTIVFLDLYDGTKVGALNCLASEADYTPHGTTGEQTQDEKNYKALTFEQLSQAEHLSIGCAVVVDGKIVLSPPTATQDFEFQVSCVRLIGGVEDPTKYPITKSTEKTIVRLRQLPFLRFRSQVMQCLFRIRSKLNLAVHLFMDQEDVQLTDPNILTISDAEGAGETFTVSPAMFSTDAEGNGIPVGLTVSSQLPLEAAITGFKQVYTCQKSFRAEKSDTNKHLAEFLHVEYEGAFLDLDGLISQSERFVKFVINYAYERCKDDFDWLETKFAPTDTKPTRSLLMEALNRPFVRIKHRDAIDLIQKLVKEKAKLPGDDGKLKKVKVKELPGYEDDLGSEHEKLLVQYFGYMAVPEDQREAMLAEKKEFGAFVYVTHWPLKIKAFYMAQVDDGSGECLSFDLLCPRVGELFGGSMREWRFDKLDEEVKRRGMDVTPIKWFLDLRKSGSMPHGGWGMGFDRLVMLVCGVQSVRDVVPFPVYYTHCPY